MSNIIEFDIIDKDTGLRYDNKGYDIEISFSIMK